MYCNFGNEHGEHTPLKGAEHVRRRLRRSEEAHLEAPPVRNHLRRGGRRRCRVLPYGVPRQLQHDGEHRHEDVRRHQGAPVLVADRREGWVQIFAMRLTQKILNIRDFLFTHYNIYVRFIIYLI